MQLNYKVETIKAALTLERLGGICFFSICAVGETLFPKESVRIAHGLLENGHFINITNNGTSSTRIRELCDCPQEWRERMHLSFSLHYLELKRLELLDKFFENIEYVRSMGVSVLVQINLYDGYMPYIDEINALCIEKIGAKPQCCATRREGKRFELHTEFNRDEYERQGKRFDSPLFDFTLRNFMVKRREFCYAGEWSGVLDLGTGILRKCYFSHGWQNIFEDIAKPIKWSPVGNFCTDKFCINSSHFLSLGIIPDIETPTYAELRNRKEEHWYSERMCRFLNSRLRENNKQRSLFAKTDANLRMLPQMALITVKPLVKKALRRLSR
jgi:hypothetical protein